jgi:peroxiredoxin
MRRPIAVGLVCLALALCGHAFAADVPDFVLKDLDGKKHTLEDLLDNSKVLVIDFWGLYCKPCNELLPHLQDYYEQYQEDGLEIVVISSDSAQNEALVEQFFNSKSGYTFLVLRDQDKDVAKQNDAEVPPVTLILNSDGDVLMRHSGYKKGQEKEIEKVIQDHLKD